MRIRSPLSRRRQRNATIMLRLKVLLALMFLLPHHQETAASTRSAFTRSVFTGCASTRSPSIINVFCQLAFRKSLPRNLRRSKISTARSLGWFEEKRATEIKAISKVHPGTGVKGFVRLGSTRLSNITTASVGFPQIHSLFSIVAQHVC